VPGVRHPGAPAKREPHLSHVGTPGDMSGYLALAAPPVSHKYLIIVVVGPTHVVSPRWGGSGSANWGWSCSWSLRPNLQIASDRVAVASGAPTPARPFSEVHNDNGEDG
jgi:hypothetical protein